MEKILGVEYPKLLTVPSLSHFDAICRGQKNKDLNDWVLQNCLSICYHKRESLNDSFMHIITLFPLTICEYFNRYSIPYDLYEKNTTLFYEMIDKGFYQIVMLDRYYIEAFWDTKEKYHMAHPALIYGYSEDTVLFSDFFPQQDSTIYAFKTMHKGELECAVKGYLDMEKREDAQDDYIVGVQCIKPCTPLQRVNSIQTIAYMANCFLTSEIPYKLLSFEGFRSMELKFFYGMDSFDEFVNAVEKAKPENLFTIVRMVQTLFIQSVMIKDCTDRFSIDDELIHLAHQYYDKVNILRNRCLKMRVVGKEDYAYIKECVVSLKDGIEKIFIKLSDINNLKD